MKEVEKMRNSKCTKEFRDETKNQSKSSQQELLEELKQLRAENKLLIQERDIFLCLHSL